MEKEKEAYNDIFTALKKFENLIVFDVKDLERKSKIHLFGLELKEVHGLDIDPKSVQSFDLVRFGDYKTIGWYGEKYNRTISWSVDGRQPVDELLLKISFCTGAYIFGQDYPTDLFQRFWLELKAFNPNYTDEANHNLYFSMDNAKEVFNSFDSIMRKYHEINKVEFKQRQIEKLKKDLDKLQQSS